MKLCWDNLEKIKLSYPSSTSERQEPELGYFYGDEPHTIITHLVYYAEGCLYCGEDFLKSKNQKGHFCDKECRHNYSEIKIFEAKCLKYNKDKNKLITKKIEKEKIKEIKKIRRNEIKIKNKKPSKEYQYIKRMGLVSYTAGSKRLDYCKTTREHPEQKNILQVKCDNPECIVYKTITNPVYRHLIETLTGKREGSHGVFCSDICKRHCRANKTAEELMVEDLWASGHYVESIKLKHKINKKEPTELKINFNIHKLVKKEKIIYDLVIENNLNKEILKLKNKEFFKRKQKVKFMYNKEFKIKMLKYHKERNHKMRSNDPILFTCNKLLAYTKTRAKEKGFEHDLTLEWITEKVKGSCPKTGFSFRCEPDIIRDLYAPSIDRIDNTKGYTMDNCQVVIWAYNCAKGPWTDEILYQVLKCII